MRLLFKEIDQKKLVTAFVNSKFLSLDLPDGKKNRLIAIIQDLMNHWKAQSIIEKEEDLKCLTETSFLKPISQAVHDHNSSISQIRNVMCDIEDEKIKERLEKAIKMNQDTFDLAYQKYKDLAVLDNSRLVFKKPNNDL